MRYLVQKYGGTSVATPERIQAVADRITATRGDVDGLVVIVSAMGHTTDELIELAHAVNPAPPAREMDMLLSAGETITAPLLTMALHTRDIDAVALSGLQAGIRTSAFHRKARITDVLPQRVLEELDRRRVVVIAGFQGATADLDITTLGRGGSDTTAVAMAVAINAQRCEIYTDVAGVFTADPRVVSTARVLPRVSYEEMLELAAVGAVVLHPRAVEIGEVYDMPIWVGSSFDSAAGTTVARGESVEDRDRVRGIAHETNVAKVTLLQVPDQPGIAATLFTEFGAAGINVDIIVQNVSHAGTTDISFTISETDLTHAQQILDEIVKKLGAVSCTTDNNIGTVSIVGTGIRGAPGVFAKAFRVLADHNINIEMISTSEIRLTCVIARDRVADAANALHEVFVPMISETLDRGDRRT